MNTLRYFSLTQLQQRLAKIKEEQRLAAMTPEAIKAQLREQNKTFVATQLPPDVTREKLLGNLNLLKFWLRSKGADAVNDRLNGRG